MFTVPDIYISNNTDFNGNLYPAHIFAWKFNGINCAAEDYTIGGTNTWQTTFKTDVKIDPAAELRIGGSSGYLMTITDNSRDNSSQNFYNITAVPSKVFELDAFLDDNFIEYDDPETLAHLMNRIGWTISGVSGIPYDYTINSKWAAQGMTKRQVIGLICQMLGANMVSWIDTTPTLFILNGAAPATISYTPRTVKKITVADYLAPGINKIWFGTDGTDVGIAYGTGAQDQQLTLPYNALIDPDSEDNDDLLQYIYAKVNGYSYHPVKLETFLAEAPTFAQLIGTTTIPTVSYTDEDSNVYSFPIFNWEVSPSGCVMEATGNSDRSVANQLVSSEIATNGKYNKFKRTLDSTVSEIADLNGDVSALNQTAASLTLSVAGKVGYDEIISSINQTAETITIQANKINLNGAVEVGPSDSQPEAFLTITPSQADMSGQHSRVQLYNNSVYVNTYDVNDKKIAFSCQQGSALGMHGLGEVNGVTYTYPDVYIFSRAADESNPAGSGFGNIFLYNGEWHRAHGITNPVDFKASAVLTAGSTTGAGGWLTLYDVDSNMVQHPNVELTSGGYGRLALKDDGVYTVSLDADNKGSMMLRPNSGTYPYAWYQTDRINMYSSATNKTHLGTDYLKVESNATTSSVLSASGVECYGNNGSGTTARKGRYTGDVLTVGTATSGTVYAELSPNRLIFWNSGETNVNRIVPQGASVIEHGTSNGWEYRKWSNGDYECWKDVGFNIAANATWTTWGGVAACQTILGHQTLPTTFLSVPHIQVSPVPNDDLFGFWIMNGARSGSQATTTKTGEYQLIRSSADKPTVAATYTVSYYVKGKVSV